MRAVAIKKGQTKERVPQFMQMGTLRCDACGEEFLILHNPESVDKSSDRLTGLKKCLPKRTSGTRSTAIGSSFQTSSRVYCQSLHREGPYPFGVGSAGFPDNALVVTVTP